MSDTDYEVIIIGGSYTVLSAALALMRFCSVAHAVVAGSAAGAMINFDLIT